MKRKISNNYLLSSQSLSHCSLYSHYFDSSSNLIFNKIDDYINIDIILNSHIRILVSGIYIINIVLDTDNDITICCTVNKNIIEDTITKSNKINDNEYHLICYTLLKLEQGDILNINSFNNNNIKHNCNISIMHIGNF